MLFVEGRRVQKRQKIVQAKAAVQDSIRDLLSYSGGYVAYPMSGSIFITIPQRI